MVTKENIKKSLAVLGLKPGDIVMVHSSLRSFGVVENGADTVIDALLSTVGPEGTVVMPANSTNRRKLDFGYEEILPFDPQETPVWTGAICERFRKRAGAIRSLDPLNSLCAIGPQAKVLTDSIDLLVDLNGYVLLLGVNLQVNSVMHLAERIAKPPQYRERVKSIKSRGFWGKVHNLAVMFFFHTENIFPFFKASRNYVKSIYNNFFQKSSMMIAPSSFGPWADFEKMATTYREAGIMSEISIGAADCKLLRSKPMIELFVEALRSNPGYFYSYRPSTYEMHLKKHDKRGARKS